MAKATPERYTRQEAKILLSAQRGCTQSTTFRSFHYFNFDRYRSEVRVPPGDLQFVNDDTLAAHERTRYSFSTDVLVLVVPLVGACRVVDNVGRQIDVAPGCVAQVFARRGFDVEFINVHEELINYFCLAIRCDARTTSVKVNDLALEHQPGRLASMKLIPKNVQGWLGTFRGRQEGRVSVHKSSYVFALALEGAFEFEKRLIQQRDGLVLRGQVVVEWEALSKEAILLLLEWEGEA